MSRRNERLWLVWLVAVLLVTLAPATLAWDVGPVFHNGQYYAVSSGVVWISPNSDMMGPSIVSPGDPGYVSPGYLMHISDGSMTLPSDLYYRKYSDNAGKNLAEGAARNTLNQTNSLNLWPRNSDRGRSR